MSQTTDYHPKVTYYHVFIEGRLQFVSLDVKEAVKYASEEFKELYDGAGFGDVHIAPYELYPAVLAALSESATADLIKS
jgi:hypothetical protein